MKSLQFELWQECNNKCKYCYLGDGNRKTDDKYKIKALDDAYEKISDLSLYPDTEVLSYLGGEFFQGQLNTEEIKSKFFKLIDKTSWLLENKYIKEVWIYATMTIGDQHDLYDCIERFKDKSKLWILTSFDTIGRFHTQSLRDNWDYHMRNLKHKYPDINLNVTTIVTGDLIEKYLNNEFTFKEFIDTYKVHMFIKQPVEGTYTKNQMQRILPNFFPKRKEFIKFLNKFKEVEDEYLYDELFDIHLRADTLYRNFNNDEERMQLITRDKEHYTSNDEEIMPCGHMKSYSAYIDCDGCVICDKSKVGNC